jgi:hypothetical protein
MKRHEAKRYAHFIIATAIHGVPEMWWDHGPDGPAIRAALAAIREQHERWSPKAADAKPRGMPKPETPLLDVIDHEPQSQLLPDGRP